MKKEIRKPMLARRKELSESSYKRMSAVICEKLIRNSRILQAYSVHIYYPIYNEVDIRPVIEFLWNNNKKVIMPKADFHTREMSNYYVISYGQLEETRFGLHEPRANSPLHLGSPDVVIVPGVAFSSDRYRLGYGSGFYDRFLKGIDSFKIGVAFEMQIIAKLPVEEYDQKLDQIITEKRVI